jgi:nitroimidazol reductase NimA-like FMN-containing flavoprotein (pyridoxamine 5'-phosphate oxidase superfamily)
MSITMSDCELDEFLQQTFTGTVISINPDGVPLPTPVWFANRGSQVFFSTMRKTQKAKNLQRDPRCVMQCEAGAIYFELRAAILTGKVREASEDEASWFHAARAEKYALSPQTQEKMPEATKRHYENPRIVFCLEAEKVKTWDNRKLRKAQ